MHGIVRFNNFTGSYGIGEIDGHGSYADTPSHDYAAGTRCIEVYNNTFQNPDDRWHNTPFALNIRGGSWLATNNSLLLTSGGKNYTDLLDFNNDWGNYVPYAPWCFISKTYVWNNTLNGADIIHYNSDNTENVDYFYRAPSIAQDGIAWTPYTYPSPLAVGTTGITNSAETLVEGTYLITIPSQIINGSYTYNFTQWQDASTNTTITVSLTANTTITATYTEITTVSVTISTPTNTTYHYAFPTLISVSFTASGGTIDKYWYNCKNGSSWIYVSNQTYITATTMSGFVNGTSYTFYAFANNTDGIEGQATVMFSVEVPYQPTGGTTSIIVNVWWGSFW
jgi:hypothetical protein